MIEVTFECDVCAKSKTCRYKSATALRVGGQPKGFRVYEGVFCCEPCRRKLMGKEKFEQNKKVSKKRQERHLRRKREAEQERERKHRAETQWHAKLEEHASEKFRQLVERYEQQERDLK